MAATKKKRRKPVILVSSTVYGSEDLLDLIYALLTNFGYEVWMSHKGTLPTVSSKTAFENCLAAVDSCDLFLSLITKQYGTGRESTDVRSITHEELLKAIKLGKPRWALAHHDVVFARTLLDHLGYKTAADRKKLALKKGAIIDDLRVIDMYEDAIRNELSLKDRKGNWVQKFATPEDATLFASAQFFRIQELRAFIEEQFEDPLTIQARVDALRGGS